jgi:hypothetical protein
VLGSPFSGLSGQYQFLSYRFILTVLQVAKGESEYVREDFGEPNGAARLQEPQTGRRESKSCSTDLHTMLDPVSDPDRIRIQEGKNYLQK